MRGTAGSGIVPRTSRLKDMPPIAAFFDMDGVLLDSFEAWLSLMNAAAVHFGQKCAEAWCAFL